MENFFQEYKLRRQLRSHEDDVRCVCICGSLGMATSSNDKTIKFWTLDEHCDYVLAKTFVGHESFVRVLAWIPPNEEFSHGVIVSSGADACIIFWSINTGEKVMQLKGHELQVTGLAVDGSDLISVSVDGTMRRWRGSQQVEVLEAHKAAIESMVRLPSGTLVTGSTDTSMKLWSGKCCITFSGNEHTDTVRALAVMPDKGLLSASEDGIVRHWATTGELLFKMVGHTSVVYSVDGHVSGLVVSGSEDCSAKLWKDGDCVQSIEHHGCVWDTKFLENGDIVTACSDGVVRVWTLEHDKAADAVELQAFYNQLSQYKINWKKVGVLKVEELPNVDALESHGTRDGQTKIVIDGDEEVAYSWNAKELSWNMIGEIFNGLDDGTKHPTGEGVRERPWFWETPTRSRAFRPNPLIFRDIVMLSGGRRDPEAYTDFCKHIPRREMLSFDDVQLDGVLDRISEFNHALMSSPEIQRISLNEGDIQRLNFIFKIFYDTANHENNGALDNVVALLLKLLKTWPLKMMFPVVDIVRMLLLYPCAASKLQHFIIGDDGFISVIRKVTTTPGTLNTQLVCLRALVNIFKVSHFSEWLLKYRAEILDGFSLCCFSSSEKEIQISYATILLNYAILVIDKNDEEGQFQVFSAAFQMAEEAEEIDLDARYRVLVAFGSLILAGCFYLGSGGRALDIGMTAEVSKDKNIAAVGVAIKYAVMDSEKSSRRHLRFRRDKGSLRKCLNHKPYSYLVESTGHHYVENAYIHAFDTVHMAVMELRGEAYANRNPREVDVILRMKSVEMLSGEEGQILCPLIVEACKKVCPKNVAFKAERVSVLKCLSGVMQDANVIHGLVLKTVPRGVAKRTERARIAIFFGNVMSLYTDFEEKSSWGLGIQSLGKSNESKVQDLMKALANNKIKVIVSEDVVSETTLQICNSHGIMVLEVSSRVDLCRLCETAGAIYYSSSFPLPLHKGSLDSVCFDKIGDCEVTVLKGAPFRLMSTIVLRGSCEKVLDTLEKAVFDAAKIYEAMCKEGPMLVSAGDIAERLQNLEDDDIIFDTPPIRYVIARVAEELLKTPSEHVDITGVGRVWRWGSTGVDFDGMAGVMKRVSRDVSSEFWDHYTTHDTRFWHLLKPAREAPRVPERH